MGAEERRADAGAEFQIESGGGGIADEAAADGSVPGVLAEPEAEITAQGNSVVGRLAGSHGGVPSTSTRRTVESEPIPATWIACGPAPAPSAAGAATFGRSWLDRSRGALGWGDGVNADDVRLPSGPDNVDRPVNPGRWNRGDGAAGKSAGLGCSGAKNSSSGSAGWSASAASRSLRSAASCASRSSRRLRNTPYPVIGTSKTANVAQENIASPPS